MWLKFIDLSPTQQVTAQDQLNNHVEKIQSLKNPFRREFLVVDEKVKGSRILYSTKDKKLYDSLGLNDAEKIRSKTDLKNWKSTPTPFSMNNE